jgi:DNA-binding CsgD family transcriptional regulator
MLNTDTGLQKTHFDLLPGISAWLALQAQRTDGFSQIPTCLTDTLQLPDLTLAIIKLVADGAAVLMFASSGGTSSEQELLDIFEQTRTGNNPEPNPDLHRKGLIHAIDEHHWLLLTIQADDVPLEPVMKEFLQALTRQLAISLVAQVIWASSPKILGEPFDQLTDREWMTLVGLNSDAGEKQLADQLGLSPHTLHSHIKSIYRKVGVQGRLSLLRRLEAALCAHRLRSLKSDLRKYSEDLPPS